MKTTTYAAKLEKGLVKICDADGLTVATLYANDASSLALARQFAAAPELLKFVAAFADSFDEDGTFNWYSAEFGTEQLHAMARAAIAKAKPRRSTRTP